VEKGKSFKTFKTLCMAIAMSLFLWQPMMAEENAAESDSVSSPKINTYEYSMPEYLVPLEIKSALDAEMIQLIKETTLPKNQFDLNSIKFEPTPASLAHVQKMIKYNRIETSLYTTSLITMTALNVADYFSTLKALKYEGLREANPIMKPFTKNAVLYTAVKLGLTAYNFHFMKKLHKKDKRLAWAVCLITNFAMTYVVINNLKMIRQAQSI